MSTVRTNGIENDESFSSPYSSPKQARALPPLRPGMPVAKRQNLFRLKLELCSVRYNFADPTTARDREIKRQTLLELIKFTNTPSGQKVFCDSSMPHVLKMLEANIFREMPAECQDLDMEEEELPVQSEWPHLQAVYEFMLRFIVSAEVKPKIARKHLHRNFCKNIIALFDSEDPRERDYLKTILHRIYGKFMTYRSLIRRHIQYVFYEFLFEKGQHNGIGELLEILGSIINGFQLPLKKEHLEFLAHTLIPLHKTTSIQFYHLQLSYCMTQYIEKDRNTAIPIVLGILKFWPWSSTSKQLLLFNELEDIMELISPTVLERVAVPLFEHIGKCIGSDHFQVQERCLFLWNNEHLVSNGCLSRQFCSASLRHVYHNLNIVAQDHWNQNVNTLARSVVSLYMGFDLALFNKVSSSNVGFKNLQDKKDAKNQSDWAEIEARAAAVRAEIEAKRAAEGGSHADTDSGGVVENASALSAASRSGGASASAGK
eukprot:INCI14935.1.p1 GENE.INCI14935.1~~INCI14935.1.p1  ORF type:complete len:487 (-),score=95.54 INCI14935.1:342-1802(-)